MAEAHPVAPANVVKAKERGAQVLHVDPHFTRTSAQTNLFVSIRMGSDIVFLGAIIRYLLEYAAYFHEYVVHYTKVSHIAEYTYCEGLLYSTVRFSARLYDPTRGP